jgi:hypothetical protein
MAAGTRGAAHVEGAFHLAVQAGGTWLRVLMGRRHPRPCCAASGTAHPPAGRPAHRQSPGQPTGAVTRQRIDAVTSHLK